MIHYFTDAVLRGPTIGCMLMSLVAALVGVIVFLRKQSLIGESISHATYPGVILGALMAGPFLFFSDDETSLTIGILIGAYVTGLVALGVIHFLTTQLKIANDAALCLVLSVFFGIGITIASRMQFTHTSIYKQALVYLYGQAATMTDIHIKIYGALALFVIAMILLFYKELKVITLDRNYAKSLGIPIAFIEILTYSLTVFAIVLGIRSVGVVLMSAMLIAPAVAARQFSHRMSQLFLFSALFGCLSGFLGIVFSVEISAMMLVSDPQSRISLPTGPMIVLVATTIALLSLLLAPQKGILPRYWRIFRFRSHCHRENILKALWYYGEGATVSLNELCSRAAIHPIHLWMILKALSASGWIATKKKGYSLTADGYKKATHIVRLHRLWEVYLVKDLGIDSERVHRSAEEMEHIITPALEKELTKLLKDPKEDPHHQPIPRQEGRWS